MKAARILVSGQVQGVGYRAWTERTARSLELVGWTRNLADGRVEVFAQGPTEAIDTFVAFCKGGPRLARVTGVDVEERETRALSTFEVKMSALGPEI